MSNIGDTQERLFVRTDYVINLNEKIGRGAFSKVYKAKYKDVNVAAKLITTSKMHKKVINQLDRELKIIEILMEYPHPNILKYYKVEKLPGYTIILMEICEGGELKKKIECGLNETTVKNYVKQLVRAYLHILKFSIVHRDLKPTNVLVSKEGTLKLIDFGLSKVLSTDMTATMCGSPLYMAPEILYKQDYDSNADIWSLGILVYEMTYGFTPFNESHDIKTLKFNILKSKIPFPQVNTVGEEVSEDCKNLMKSLLSVDVDNRIDWTTIGNNVWICDEFLEYNTDISKPVDKNRVKIIEDLHKMLRGDFRHEPIITKNDEHCAYDDDMIFSMESDPIRSTNIRTANIPVSKKNGSTVNEISGLSGLSPMGSPIIDTYIDKELEDVNLTRADKSIPIPIRNKFSGGSRLDYVDFGGLDKSKHVRSDTTDSITQYLYSRSAPVGIRKNHR